MFPFKVRYDRTIRAFIDPEKFSELLDFSGNLLSKEGADYFSREGNRLKFENRLFKLTWNWELMVPIGAGFVEIKEGQNNNIKIRYSITLTRVWALSVIAAFIIWISNKDIIWSLVAIGFLGGLNWIIAVIRHWVFFYEMTNTIIKNKINVLQQRV